MPYLKPTMRSFALMLAALLPLPVAAQAPHAVVATTPDLAALCRAVGGDQVAVTCFVVGPQDPHYLDPRPSMLYAMQKAELVVQIGRDLESGWLPVLINSSRNPATQPGQIGHLDASRAVRALNVPTATTTRAAGDVHLAGNPHFLLDPLCGLEVAALLRDRFAVLWPAGRDAFAANFAAFRQRMAEAMVGPELARLYEHDAEKLARAFGNGALLDVLKAQGDLGKLAGWFGATAPLRGSQVVVDHDLWPYFAERFGLVVFGYLEPRPGMTPTSAHLSALVERMRGASVRVVMASSYFPTQYANVVQKALGAVVVPMAHQPGARAATDGYVEFVDYNVRTMVAALKPKANG
jgi:ABC-type Zn uptake system ZnuABC Zn-binding protein ZnuA